MPRVTVIRDLEKQVRAEALREKALELAQARKDLGIPAYTYRGTMIRGAPLASNDGVTIQVGLDWEKESYNRQEIRRQEIRQMQRPSRKVVRPIPGTYVWKYPSVIILRATTSGFHLQTLSEQREQKISGWVESLVQVGKSIGLKVSNWKRGDWYAELSL